MPPSTTAAEDAHCVMHTHTTAGVAVACLRAACSRPTSTPRSCTTWWRTTISRASPSMPTRRRACWPAWAIKPAVILRNHGLLAGAPRCRRPLRSSGRCSAPAMSRWRTFSMGRGDSRSRKRSREKHARLVPVQPSARRRPGRVRRLVRQVEPLRRPTRTEEAMKVCIYGAGAIGGWLGVKLAHRPAASSAWWRAAPPWPPCRRDGLRCSKAAKTARSVPVQAVGRAGRRSACRTS
jgi:hypothetical protein